MSHFTTIKTEIRDLETCKSALKELGLDVEATGYCRYWGGKKYKENVVRLPGQYDMSLELQKNGAYFISADFEGDVEKTIGNKGGRLLQEYAKKEFQKTCKKMHLSISPNPKEPNSFKVKDPKDASSGHMIVSFDEAGNVDFKPKGIKGKKCTKFLGLEEALGKVAHREFLPEYYRETEKERTKTERVRERVRI